MSLQPLNQKPLKIYGPQGIPEAISGQMDIKKHYWYGVAAASQNTHAWMYDNSKTALTVINAHGSTAVDGHIVGGPFPFWYTQKDNSASDKDQFDGIDELIKIWPNITVRAMRLKLTINMDSPAAATPNRYLLLFRWLRSDDVPEATLDAENILEDPSWTRIQFKRVSTTGAASLNASDMTWMEVEIYNTWSKIYPYDEDDSWENQRTETDGTTWDELPNLPMILQYTVVNAATTETWTSSSLIIYANYTMYYTADRYTGANVFIES